jgi:hypothetical protein
VVPGRFAAGRVRKNRLNRASLEGAVQRIEEGTLIIGVLGAVDGIDAAEINDEVLNGMAVILAGWGGPMPCARVLTGPPSECFKRRPNPRDQKRRHA